MFNLDLFKRSNFDGCLAMLEKAKREDLEDPEVCRELRKTVINMLPSCPKDGQNAEFFRDKTLKVCEYLSRDWESNIISKLSSRTLATILRLIVNTTEEKKEIGLAKDCFATIAFNRDEFMIENETLYCVGQILVPDVDDGRFVDKMLDIFKIFSGQQV